MERCLLVDRIRGGLVGGVRVVSGTLQDVLGPYSCFPRGRAVAVWWEEVMELQGMC